MGDINWDSMTESKFYVQLKDNTPKKLVLANWRTQEQFKDNNNVLKPGIAFDVVEEDGIAIEPLKDDEGNDTTKSWTVTARGAMVLLRPICEKAVAEGKETILVSVTRTGTGKKTTYSIAPLD